jgi:hypothetical protein
MTLRECRKHGLVVHYSSKCKASKGGIRLRCKQCVLEANRNTRRKNKEILVSEFGGECIICGYDKCNQALHFHHLDPSIKEFGIGLVQTASIAKLREEAKKCVLLCNRCHTEVEEGITEIPRQFRLSNSIA